MLKGKRNVKRKPVGQPWGNTTEERRRLKAGREEVPLGELELWADNPRLNDDAVPKLMELIKEHGFAGILVATPDGTVWAGNTRLKALRLLQDLGWKGADKVWVEWRTFPTKLAAEAFALADNKAGEWADWDHAKLAGMFKQRATVDMGVLEKATGFKRQEIEWQGAAPLDPDEIANFEEPDREYVIRVDGVLEGDKDEVVEAVEAALEGWDYDVKAF